LMLSNTVIPCSRKNFTIENLSEDLVHVINQQLCDNTLNKCDVFQSVKCLVTDGHSVKVGQYIVLDLVLAEDIPRFVYVKHILSVRGMWLVCGTVYDVCRFDRHLHAYIVQTDCKWAVFRPGQNVDFQCLSAYSHKGDAVIILQHAVASRAADQ
jgi:hypothetical protein